MGQPVEPTDPAIPYTRWYNVHERHSLSEFKTEGFILGVLLVVVLVHILGTRANRRKAKAWVDSLTPSLRNEFALVGFGGSEPPSAEEVDSEGLAKTTAAATDLPEVLLKEKSPQEFSTYASGRQNIAFLDVNLTLLKRYNPMMLVAEYGLSLFFESMSAPVEHVEAIMYPFDGKEAQTVPGQLPGAHELRKDSKSSYDGFVWAVVNKDTMKKLRDDRYDVSITTTKDLSKLPNWTTVMSESAEVTDMLLTQELITAIEKAGDLFEHLVVTDQPIDRPLKYALPLHRLYMLIVSRLDETNPKKRIYLALKIPSSSDYSSALPIFEYFLRLPDLLVQSAHFRPETLRRIRNTREDLMKKLQKAVDDEKAEERALEREKAKKTKRDMELKGLDAKAQKKYLEKEREKEMRKTQKRQTMRG